MNRKDDNTTIIDLDGYIYFHQVIFCQYCRGKEWEERGEGGRRPRRGGYEAKWTERTLHRTKLSG